jgi:hypothetical protein
LAAVNASPGPTACCATVGDPTVDAPAMHARTRPGLKVCALKVHALKVHAVKVYGPIAHHWVPMICGLMTDDPSADDPDLRTRRATADDR